MFSPKDSEEFAQRVRDLLEKSPMKDLDKNFRAFTSAMFDKANLVGREEFDAQSQMLSKAFAKLEEIEEQVRKISESLPDAKAGKQKGKKRKAPGKSSGSKDAGEA